MDKQPQQISQTPTPAARIASGILQRKCECGQHTGGDGCSGCEKKRLQRSTRNSEQQTTNAGGVPAIVHEVLRSSGQPLDPSARALFEPRFGHDFSHVRVHTDVRAGESARSVNALAYTVGNQIVFESGRYQPGTAAGHKLLAHELTHVLQQQSTSNTVQTQLTVGAPHDSAEQEADQVAERMMKNPRSETSPQIRTTQSPPVIRRQLSSTELDQALAGAPANPGPQQVGQTRMVTLPIIRRGESVIVPHVTRSLVPCPCRRVPETRTGRFWNPDLDAFAIAFVHCRGQRSVTAYVQSQSDLTSALNAGRRPQGRVEIGGQANIAGTRNQGTVELEAVVTNEPAGVPGTSGSIPAGTPGAGPGIRVVVRGSDWAVFGEAEYVRRFGTLPAGTDPNQFSAGAGVQLGRGGPTVSGRFRTGGGETSGNIFFETPIGGPPRPDCFNCFCPPPTRQYECIDFERDRDERRPTEVVTHPSHEYRYYFRLDQGDPEPTLLSESNANMDQMAQAVRDGGTIEYITAYASPEIEESHNRTLSQLRAEQMNQIVQQRLGPRTDIPPAFGGGELLGSRPTTLPSSRLGDVITRSGFRSAENLSVLLAGDEIPNPELASQFLSLFRALPDPSDRLAVFGLTDSDHMAPQVLAAIRGFEASRGRGRRPWEKIFRLLRVGVVRVTSTVRTPGTQIVHVRGETTRPSAEVCRRRGETAEAMTPGFGPIDPSALHPVATPEQVRDDCERNPPAGPADRARGCHYGVGASSGRRAPAPAFAPVPFGQRRP